MHRVEWMRMTEVYCVVYLNCCSIWETKGQSYKHKTYYWKSDSGLMVFPRGGPGEVSTEKTKKKETFTKRHENKEWIYMV